MKKSVCLLAVAVLVVGIALPVPSKLAAQTPQKRCHTMENLDRLMQQYPELAQKRALTDQRLSQQSGQAKQLANNVITIPVVFHVIHNGDAVGSGENISDALIIAQMAQLNDDFRRTNADAGSTPLEFLDEADDAEVEFCFASTDPSGNPTTGIERINISTLPGVSLADCWESAYIDLNIKIPTTWNSRLYLNIWVTEKIDVSCAPVLLGYAQFPDLGPDNTDGVVVVSTSVGSLAMPSGGGGPFDRGRTLTHEVGHWIHLYHIWGDDLGLCSGSDQVADTPNQGDSNVGCPAHPKVSCSNNEMFTNYMDYTDDLCMNLFTDGQSDRMHLALDLLRPGVISDWCGGNCPANLRLTQTDPGTLGANITIGYDADFELRASNVIATGGIVEYRAGESIRLLPDPMGIGFWAQSGSQFRAHIQDCDGSTKPGKTTPRENEANAATKAGFSELQVSPNPSSGQFLIQYRKEGDGPVSLSINSQTGAFVRHLKRGEHEMAGEHQVVFDGSSLPAGVYNLVLYNEGKILTKKLVVLK